MAVPAKPAGGVPRPHEASRARLSERVSDITKIYSAKQTAHVYLYLYIYIYMLITILIMIIPRPHEVPRIPEPLRALGRPPRGGAGLGRRAALAEMLCCSEWGIMLYYDIL